MQKRKEKPKRSQLCILSVSLSLCLVSAQVVTDTHLSSQDSGWEQEEQEVKAAWATGGPVSLKKQQTSKNLKNFIFLFVSHYNKVLF